MTASPAAGFEQRIRALEEAYLWEPATRSYPAHRLRQEPDSPVRTPFQRDRDRIAHSKAFRRLKHKTQVFIAPEGDHYRTRLTHTLETCFIARTVARALGLNEDLTEAIGLGHDLGHPPFGHIGEEVLDDALKARGGDRLPSQRALAATGRAPRTGRPRTQPDRPGAGRDPQPHRLAEAGDARGQGRAARRPGRLHQPRHRRRRPRRDHRRERPAGRADRPARPDRLGPDRRAGPRHRRALPGGRRHRPERRDGRGDAAPAQVHVRSRLPRPRRTLGARAGAADADDAHGPLPRAPRADAAGPGAATIASSR